MKQIYKQLRSFIAALFFCVSPFVSFGQTNITGTVRDDQKLPLPGVSVTISGSNKGTVTDINGRYIIPAVKGQTITFAFIGYEPQRITVGDKNMIDVNLVGSTKTLNEVVVTAP